MTLSLRGALLASWLLATSVSADEPLQQTSSFWLRATSPATARAQNLVRQGRALWLNSKRGALLDTQGRTQRKASLESARVRFERAHRLAADDLETLYWLGRTLAELAQLGEETSSAATSCLRRLRSLDARFEAASVAFELGELYARDQHFADAAREYEDALTLSLADELDPYVIRRYAEALMVSGDIDAAVTQYERAVTHATGDARGLAMWGLAVALDRAGERQRADELAARALQQLEEPVRRLEEDGVHFQPAYERDYYEGVVALAHAARHHGNDAEAAAELESALAAFSRYLTATGAEGLYSARARAHQQQLRARLAEFQTRNKMQLTGSPKARVSASP